MFSDLGDATLFMIIEGILSYDIAFECLIKDEFRAAKLCSEVYFDIFFATLKL